MASKPNHETPDHVIGIVVWIGIWLLAILFIWLLGILGLDDRASTGQLVFDFLMVPLTVFGFIYTRRAFLDSRREPQLDLKWSTMGQELRISRKEYLESGQILVITPTITNSGSTFGLWYHVSLDIPQQLSPWREMFQSGFLRPIVGITDNGDLDNENWTTTYTGNDHLAGIEFSSLGKHAVLPGLELPLAHIYLDLRPETPLGEHAFHYTVWAATEEPITNTLLVTILP